MLKNKKFNNKIKIQKCKTDGITVHPSTRFIMNSAATSAFDFPISHSLSTNLNSIKNFCQLYRNKNCLFKLDKSIVSMSITSIFLKPDNACENKYNTNMFCNYAKI